MLAVVAVVTEATDHMQVVYDDEIAQFRHFIPVENGFVQGTIVVSVGP